MRGDIHGVRIARGAPPVSHLFFADDSLLFFKADLREAQSVLCCLWSYCDASGQSINFDKSAITFSLNTPTVIREAVANCFDVKISADLGRYLGLPACMGRNKTAIFRFLEQRVRERVVAGSIALFRKRGKKFLLKALHKHSLSLRCLFILSLHTLVTSWRS